MNAEGKSANSPGQGPSTGDGPAPHLKRVLKIQDLVFFGLVLIQPIAPVGIFGLSCQLSRGHAATTILVAMVAMSLTALSYGRMAALYPSAGSAYTYVGRGLGAHLGFLAGWAMFLDYLLIPLINIVYGSLTLQRLIPMVPYAVWVVLLAVATTALNLRGVKATARANTMLLAVMCLVVAGFVVLAIRYLALKAGWAGVFSVKPIYDARTFNWSAIATATSLAALTYIGFDGVTTLAEEVKNPKRNVPMATVLVCLLTGLFSVVEVYLAQMAWPDYSTFTNPETAFMDVTRLVGGAGLFQAMGLVLILACLGSGLAGQAGLARLLYGMGRDGVLPQRVFGHLSPGSNIPSYNIVMTALLGLAGALVVPYERAAELLNFGAFLAFMGVNLAAIREYAFRRPGGRKPQVLLDVFAPGLGFLVCLVIWLSLPRPAKLAGGAWLALGIAYLAVITRGFRKAPARLDLRGA